MHVSHRHGTEIWWVFVCYTRDQRLEKFHSDLTATKQGYWGAVCLFISCTDPGKCKIAFRCLSTGRMRVWSLGFDAGLHGPSCQEGWYLHLTALSTRDPYIEGSLCVRSAVPRPPPRQELCTAQSLCLWAAGTAKPAAGHCCGGSGNPLKEHGQSSLSWPVLAHRLTLPDPQKDHFAWASFWAEAEWIPLLQSSPWDHKPVVWGCHGLSISGQSCRKLTS